MTEIRINLYYFNEKFKRIWKSKFTSFQVIFKHKKFSVLKFKKEKLEQIDIKNYVDLKEFWENKFTYFIILFKLLKI